MPRNSTMSISVTPRHQRLIQAKLATGGYDTPSEIVREALQLLEKRDREQDEFWADVRRKVAVAQQNLREGKGIPGDQARAEMEAYVKAKLTGRKNGRKTTKAARP